MPKQFEYPKLEQNEQLDALAEKVLAYVTQEIEARWSLVGEAKYGRHRWVRRPAKDLQMEGVNELIDYINWQIMMVCRMLIENDRFMEFLNNEDTSK